MEKIILKSFSEFLEKQDLLCKLTENSKLNDLGYSEIHTVVAIHVLEDPNVTVISNYLKLTKGAISKIIKKLIKKNLVKAYQKTDNKQKIFYMLTDKGKQIYEYHLMRHELWEKRDKEFFSKFTYDELLKIKKFMEEYNIYLGNCIDEIEKENHV